MTSNPKSTQEKPHLLALDVAYASALLKQHRFGVPPRLVEGGYSAEVLEVEAKLREAKHFPTHTYILANNMLYAEDFSLRVFLFIAENFSSEDIAWGCARHINSTGNGLVSRSTPFKLAVDKSED